MKIKKSQLEPLLKALNYPIKKFAQARIRDRFVKQLSTEYQTFNQEREEILKKYAEKKNGEPIINNNQYSFKPEVVEKVQKEVDILFAEEIPIEMNGEVKALIDNSTAEFEIGQADLLTNLIEDLEPKKKK